jgi:hypothetical protein
MNCGKISFLLFPISGDQFLYRICPYLALLFALNTLAMPVQAQDNDESTDEVSGLDLFDDDTERTRKGWAQLYVSAGITYMDADGSFSARLPGGKPVTIIDFERLGLREEDTSLWFTLKWRSENSHWGAWFGSWRYDVTGSRVWQDSIDLGDGLVIPVGASVASDFDAKWYVLEATYSFYRTENIDTGIGFGVHTVDLSTSLTARFQIGEQETEVVSKRLHALAPLPNVLGYFHWKYASRWSVSTRVGWFGLDYNEFSGRMINAHGMVSFELSPRWSLALGYQYIDLDLNIEKKHYVQVYDINFAGPVGFVRFNF